jgi:hypothetical protein
MRSARLAGEYLTFRVTFKRILLLRRSARLAVWRVSNVSSEISSASPRVATASMSYV